MPPPSPTPQGHLESRSTWFQRLSAGPKWRRQGTEPDYRFTLANERTFLAWIRTSLSLLAGAVLLRQFGGTLLSQRATAILAVSLALIASLLSFTAYLHWKKNEIAMRHSRPLEPSFGIPLLSCAMLLVGAVLAMLLWAAP